jgi:long-chain acyl-CoA synthetase
MGFRAVSTTGFATPFIYSSYTECLARIDAFAAGLDTLKLIQPNEDGLAVLALYMKNCMEGAIGEHGAFAIGGSSVLMYDTLGPDTVTFILDQTSARSVVCTRAELPKLCESKVSGKCPAFTAAILVDGVTEDAAKMALEAGLEVLSFAKVEAVGAVCIAEKGHHHRPPAPTDVAAFCYTSGTTGNPKGALLTHENIMSAIAGFYGAVGDLEAQPFDRHLSYLPLAHIFERIVSSQMFCAGASVAFFRGDPTLLIEDMQACRPTVMPVAPRVLNKIYDKIQAGISSVGGLKKKLFDAAVAAKAEGLQSGHMKHALYDRLIFNKIKKGLGMDQLRMMVSGSAPLNDTVMTFFRCMLAIPVVEGYGQTEGAAAATIGSSDDMATVGHVGGPVGSVEIVLVDVPEMGYFHTDTLHRGMACQGRGEICVRGPSVFKGYYKDDLNTRETIDNEGWLHSGDVGLWRPDGNLQIIDRKKNIFKLSQGEYVAPEKIENFLISSPLIGQCFVYGDSYQNSLVGLMVPDEEPVRTWAAVNAPELKSASLAEMCNSEALKAAVMADVQRIGVESRLLGFEKPKDILLVSVPFTIENEMMTPTFKLKRQKIRDTYEKEIDLLYAGLPPPLSKL